MCQNLDFWFIIFYYLLSSFLPPIFTFLLNILLSFLIFQFGFLSSFVFYVPSFSLLFYPCFLSHVISSLSYPNLLENNIFSCCYYLYLWIGQYLYCKYITYLDSVDSEASGRSCPHGDVGRAGNFFPHVVSPILHVRRVVLRVCRCGLPRWAMEIS
jgi:hypothetical protein